MSCIIEGSLEILRPIAVAAAAVVQKEDACASRTLLLAASDDESASFQQQTQHHADEELKESRANQKQGEEESDDFDEDDSFMKTDEVSGSDEEDELFDEGRKERATTISRKELYEEAQFQSKVELLREYKRENGHCRVQWHYDINGVKLGKWLKHQKEEYKKYSAGKPAYIRQERIDKLKAVGFDFNDTRQKRDEAQWQSKLELLRQYQERNGHCRVPERSEIDGVKLGSWLTEQRAAYKRRSDGKPARKITQERIDQLEVIGFDFNDTKQKRDEAQWQSKLELLRQYQERNGHCQVPERSEIDGVKLGSWLTEQRAAYKRRSDSKPARKITQECIDQLEAIGFDFNDTKPKREEAMWQSRFEQLRQYQVRNGHCRVPQSFEIDGVKLGRWIDSQRMGYKKHSEGKVAKIAQQRINALNAIGFEWCPGKSKKSEGDNLSSDESSSGKEMTAGRNPLSWKRTMNPTSDRHSSAVTNTSSASHPRSGRQQASHSKTRGLNEQSRMTITSERTLGSKKHIELSIDAAGFQEEESPARSCQLSNQRAPLENRVTRSNGGCCITTKSTPITNCHLRKRAVPTVEQLTKTVPKRSSPRLKCGKRKRNTPELLVLDPTRNQATVANQTLAKVEASHGRNSHSVTCHSSRRTVSERLKSAKNPAVESIATATATNTQWDEHFDRLVEFKWNHGHCHVPVDFCVDDSYYLGQWVVVQRLQHNRLMDGRPSSITAEQVERLNMIDFIWKVR